jgi:hypothetical protein
MTGPAFKLGAGVVETETTSRGSRTASHASNLSVECILHQRASTTDGSLSGRESILDMMESSERSGKISDCTRSQHAFAANMTNRFGTERIVGEENSEILTDTAREHLGTVHWIRHRSVLECCEYELHVGWETSRTRQVRARVFAHFFRRRLQFLRQAACRSFNLEAPVADCRRHRPRSLANGELPPPALQLNAALRGNKSLSIAFWY